MNRKQKLKSLTWKYFWEQKIKEIRKAVFFTFVTLLIIAAFMVIPYLLGHFIGDNVSGMCSEEWDSPADCDEFMQWIEGTLYLFIPFMGIVFLGGWLKENWKKAKKRAKTELNHKGGENGNKS